MLLIMRASMASLKSCQSTCRLISKVVSFCRQMRPQRSSSGSAFITDTSKKTIMTNSHVVSCSHCFPNA